MNDYQCNLGFINIFILFDSCFQLYRLWLAELPWELGQLGQFGKVLAKIWPRHSHTQNFLMQSAQKIFQEIGQQANTEPRKACLCWRFTSWILSMSDTASSSLLEKNSNHPTLQCFPYFVQEFSGEKSVKAVPHHCVCGGIIISSPPSPVGRLIPFKCWNRSQDPTNNSPGRLFTSQVAQPTS